MMRLIRNCAISIAIYLLLFSVVLDRPLTLGSLALELREKASAIGRMASPKLVILAGSNGPYSHSCVVIGAMLRMPCENAGIAVGVGLDTLFNAYASELRPGDIVYMPLELRQYTVTRLQVDAGVDSAMLLRGRQPALRGLPADRQLGAMFCCTLADFLSALVEGPISRLPGLDPKRLLAREYNDSGDRIYPARSRPDIALRPLQPRAAPTPQQLRDGYGAVLTRNFVREQARRGVRIIGGLPTDFDTAEISSRSIAGVATIYRANGGAFLELPNHSQYPPADFFDSEDHLLASCQILHSILLAPALAEILEIPVFPASPSAQSAAAACPGQQARLQAIAVAR